MGRPTSEFGKGLIICLVKFAEHISQHNADKIKIYEKWLKETPENQKLMLSKNPPPNLNYGFPYMNQLKTFVEIADKVYKGDYKKYLSSECEMIMNASSDHLYEIEVPKGKKWDEIRKMVNRLQKKALTMGHGFTKKTWKPKDVDNLFELNRKIALKIDKEILGLKAQKGKW